MRFVFSVFALACAVAAGAVVMSAPAEAQGTVCCRLPNGTYQSLIIWNCSGQGGQVVDNSFCAGGGGGGGGGAGGGAGVAVGDVALTCCRSANGSTSLTSRNQCLGSGGSAVARSLCLTVADPGRDQVCCAYPRRWPLPQRNAVTTRAACESAGGTVETMTSCAIIRDHRTVCCVYTEPHTYYSEGEEVARRMTRPECQRRNGSVAADRACE